MTKERGAKTHALFFLGPVRTRWTKVDQIGKYNKIGKEKYSDPRKIVFKFQKTYANIVPCLL